MAIIVLCGVVTTIEGTQKSKTEILPHIGILIFYSARNNNDVLSRARAINRDQFKISMSTKVC